MAKLGHALARHSGASLVGLFFVVDCRRHRRTLNSSGPGRYDLRLRLEVAFFALSSPLRAGKAGSV